MLCVIWLVCELASILGLNTCSVQGELGNETVCKYADEVLTGKHTYCSTQQPSIVCVCVCMYAFACVLWCVYWHVQGAGICVPVR